MNFGFIIDNRKCIGCHACTVACKAEHDVPIGVNRTWVKYIEKGEFPHTRRIFSVMRCNHCEEAPCVAICPVTALYKREDGIVDFDNRRCIGCKACTQACPYDAIYIDPNTHTAAKCNYCAHRIDIGLEPACVNVCPEHAIISGDLDDPNSEISQLLAREQVTARKVEKGTRPKLFYIDGDEASLTPTTAEPDREYMWSTQATGVGHYAKYAESRTAQANPKQLIDQLQGSSKNKSTWVGGEESNSEVLVPSHGDSAKMWQKALDVLKEKTRRVYDAPQKGVVWGWEVSTYVWTKAIAAGVLLVPFTAWLFKTTTISQSIQWLGLAFGLIFLILTGVLLIKDLDKPARFAYVLLRPQWNSWLVRGGYGITFYGAFLSLLGIAKWFHLSQMVPLTLWFCAILAIFTAVYTAFLFAQAKGRDFWQSPTMALHMLVHAFMAGASVFALLTIILPVEASWQSYLRHVFILSIILNLLILTFELITPHATEDAHRVVKMIVSGRFRLPFWFGTVIIGNIVPLILIWPGTLPLMALTGALVLIGLYFTEHIWVRAPQLIPLS